MKNKKLISVLLLAIVLLSACAKPKEFKVMDAWACPASAGENSAAYFIISNATNADDTLVSTSTDAASAAEVHMNMMGGNDVISMKMQEAVRVPAQQEVIFKPGGLHVMLIGLTRDLKSGDTISLTLNFKEAGSVTVEVAVEDQ